MQRYPIITGRARAGAGAQAKLVRINPQLPLADDPALAKHVIPVLAGGLDALDLIHRSVRAGPRAGIGI